VAQGSHGEVAQARRRHRTGFHRDVRCFQEVHQGQRQGEVLRIRNKLREELRHEG